MLSLYRAGTCDGQVIHHEGGLATLLLLLHPSGEFPPDKPKLRSIIMQGSIRDISTHQIKVPIVHSRTRTCQSSLNYLVVKLYTKAFSLSASTYAWRLKGRKRLKISCLVRRAIVNVIRKINSQLDPLAHPKWMSRRFRIIWCDRNSWANVHLVEWESIVFICSAY